MTALQRILAHHKACYDAWENSRRDVPQPIIPAKWVAHVRSGWEAHCAASQRPMPWHEFLGRELQKAVEQKGGCE